MANAPEYHAHSVAGVDVDIPAKEMLLAFEHGADRQKVVIRLVGGAVAGLAMAIRDQYKKIVRSDAERAAVMQPLVVHSASAFALPSGKVGLAIDIENFELPLLMTPEIISGFRASLDEVERLSKNPPKPPRRN